MTGASGMLGRQIFRVMQNAGWRVIGSGRSRPEWIAGRDWVEWDLTQWVDSDTLDQWFSRAEVIVHAGALVPSPAGKLSDKAMLEANVRACQNISAWSLLRGVPLVYLSGAIVYSEPEFIGITEDRPLGRNRLGGLYGLTKLMGEQVISYYRDMGMKGAILRPTSIYGPGMSESKMVASFMAKALRGETIQLLPPVNDRVNLIHSSDVADAVRLAVEKGWYGVANLASATPVSIIELATECVAVAGSGHVEIGGCDEADSHVPITRFDLSTQIACDLLGWQAKVTLRQGLAQLAEYIVNN